MAHFGLRACVTQAPLLRAAFFPLVLLAAAVDQRALENCVHDASHATLYRWGFLNRTPESDAEELQPRPLGRALRFLSLSFTYVIFRDVDEYHQNHRRHHEFFGDERRDPDAEIYNWPALATFGDVLAAMLHWYRENFRGAWDFVANRDKRPEKVAAAVGLLAACVAAEAGGQPWRWLGVWLLAYFLVLPPLRMVAEHEEHTMLVGLLEKAQLHEWMGASGRAAAGEEALAKTLADLQWTMSRTNVGFWHGWVFHPNHDGYHAVHHLSPRVPFFALRKAHTVLQATNATFKELCHENRVPFVLAFRWRSQ